GLEPLGRTLGVDFDDDAGRAEHAGGAGLCGSHAAEAGSQEEATAQVREPEPGCAAGENLVRTLQHALRSDVLPTTGRQPAPADEIALLEVVEDLLARP